MSDLEQLTTKQRERYQRMLSIAGTMFLEKGYSSTSMAEIVAATGGSKATLYSYFPSKETLFEAFMLNEIERNRNVVFAMPEHTSNPAQALFQLGFRFLDLLTQPRTLELFRLAMHESRKFPKIGQFFYQHGPASSHQKISRFIAKANAEGNLNAEDPELAAQQFLMLCQAKFVLPYQFGAGPQPNNTEKEKIIRAAVDTFMARFGKK